MSEENGFKRRVTDAWIKWITVVASALTIAVCATLWSMYKTQAAQSIILQEVLNRIEKLEKATENIRVTQEQMKLSAIEKRIMELDQENKLLKDEVARNKAEVVRNKADADRR